MKTLSLAAAFALLVTSTTRAQDTHEKLIDEMMPQLVKLGDQLTTIKDKKSADDAKLKIKPIAAALLALKERADKLGEPTGDTKTEIEKKYKPKMEEISKKLSGEMIRIATMVEGGPDIVKEIAEGLPKSTKKK